MSELSPTNNTNRMKRTTKASKATKKASAKAPKTTLSREEQRAYQRIDREQELLKKQVTKLNQKIIERRCPCSHGDLIEFECGSRGIVVYREVVIGWNGDQPCRKIRINYGPVRGKNRVLKGRRFFYKLDTIKVIEPKSERTIAMLRGI